MINHRPAPVAQQTTSETNVAHWTHRTHRRKRNVTGLKALHVIIRI